MSIPIRSMSAMRCSGECALRPRALAVRPVDRLAAAGWRRFPDTSARPPRCPRPSPRPCRCVTWQWMSIVNHLPRACAGPRKTAGDPRAFGQAGEQHLGTPAHVGICEPGITSTARLSLHAGWSMRAAGNCHGNLCASGASQVCQHLCDHPVGNIAKEILNADVSKFTLMHADGDTRLKTRRIRYGPCPVNHTDPSACFACIYFHLR